MTYRGRVKNGVVVIEQPADLAEGTEVLISPATEAIGKSDELRASSNGKDQSLPSEDDSAEDLSQPTWAEVFKDIIGKGEGLPSDSSINHDHYLYGTPKRQ